MVVWLRRILTANKLYLRCTRSSKGALWEENFALVAVVNARNAGWCSKSDGVSSAASAGDSCVFRAFSNLPDQR